MKSEEWMNERRKVLDLTKTLGTMSPDKNTVMFKIAVHNEDFEVILEWLKSYLKTYLG